MGYSEVDQKAINTIRTLAVSTLYSRYKDFCLETWALGLRFGA